MARRFASICLAFLALALIVLPASDALARASGIAAASCGGCHGSTGSKPSITLEPSALDVAFGQTIQLKITISTPSVAGIFLRTAVGSQGTYEVVNGQQTALSGSGVQQTSPKRAVNGVATFLVNWTAPFEPGGVMFSVAALAANGDGERGGDSSGDGQVSVAVGCMGPSKVFFRDFDGDGHGVPGRDDLRACVAPQYYSELGDDCDDNDERNFPANPELCDLRDNNCNGVVDEGLAGVTLYEDADGDGFGRFGGMTHVGCSGLKGWGIGQGDCDDNNPAVHPGAAEVCNGQDEDCNTQIDNGVLPDCGLGWCRRLAYSCAGTCIPGEPRVETCNYFDDDCDGQIDEDPNLCPAGQGCVAGVCVVGASVPPPPPPPPEAGGAMSSGGAPPGSTMSGGGGSASMTPKPPAAAGGAKSLVPGSSTGSGAGAAGENVSGCALGASPPAGRAVLLVLGAFVLTAARRRRHTVAS